MDGSARRGIDRRTLLIAAAIVAIGIGAGVIAALLVGRGGGSPATPPDLASLMERTGCRGDVRGIGEELFVLEAVTCETADRSYIGIATFANRADRDAWVMTVKAFDYPVETGSLWAVSGTDPVAVKAFANAIK